MSSESTREKVLSMVKELILPKLRGKSANVYLFGSFARNEETHSSDIDIAIDHGGNITPHQFAELRELLHESPVPYNVDIVDLRVAGDLFAEKVRREGILWNE